MIRPEIPEHRILEVMLKYGGSFIKSLADTYQKADAENRQIIRTAFAHYWSEYEKMARHDRP